MSNPTIRVLAILSLLTSISPRKMGLVEICARLGIAKSTACLVLSELCASGYLIQEHKTMLYGLGMKVGLQPAALPIPSVALSDISELLSDLHKELKVPLSVVSLSRRSAIVTHTTKADSVLARPGFRRPYMAPFGACFLLGATESEKNQWMELALQMEQRNLEQLQLSIDRRLNRVFDLGYEVVYQWEQSILDTCEASSHRWIGDLFELDARTNAYRREVLHTGIDIFQEDSIYQGDHEVSRIVLPFFESTASSPTCIEFWLEGAEMSGAEIHEFAEVAQGFIRDHSFA